MHIHSIFSDGDLSPEELLELAKEKNLKKLSITDHDCVDFYVDEKNINLLEKGKFDYIVGCEFTSIFEDVPIEILGYGIDAKKAKRYLDKHGVTQNKLEVFRDDQVPKIFARFGIKIDYDRSKIDFSNKNPKGLPALFDSILRNKDAVKLLKEDNPRLIESKNFLLREGLNNPNSKFRLDPTSFYPSYKKVIKKIQSFGGLCFLAHPYQYKENMVRVLDGIKDYVDGIECYHYTSIEDNKTEFLIDFCKKNNLMISGGSDFHYNIPNNNKSHINGLGVPAKYFDLIKAKLENKSQSY